MKVLHIFLGLWMLVCLSCSGFLDEVDPGQIHSFDNPTIMLPYCWKSLIKSRELCRMSLL